MRRRPSLRHDQRGITLMLAIMVLLAITFSAFGLMYYARYDSAVSSNGALNAAALEASDIGLQAASTALEGLGGYPETMNMGPYPWWDTNLPLSPSGVPAPGDPQNATNWTFWQNCATAKTCAQILVPFAGRNLLVEYVIEPTGLRPQVLNGSQVLAGSGGPTTTYRLYDAFVNVAGGAGSNFHLTVEAALRKGG